LTLSHSRKTIEKSANGIALSVAGGLFLFHLYIIHKYAVDIPYLDDWAIFRAGRPAQLSFAWLFDAGNMRSTVQEHVIATTKLFVWMQYHLNGWNIPVNLVLNFLIFGFFVWWMFWFADKAVPEIPRYAKLAFTIFLLSPIDWFNHFMATQTCFLVYLIFFFLGSYLLLQDTQRWLQIVAGSLLCLLAIYSLASGWGSCLVLLIAFCVFKAKRIFSNDRLAHAEILQLATIVLLVGGALLYWISQYSNPPNTTLVLPNDRRFWQFFLNLVSFGFGIEKFSTAWGMICLLVVLVPIGAIIWKSKAQLTSVEWVSFVMVAGILVNVAEIAIGRAGPGVAAGSKAVRYVEFVLPLIPLSMIHWAILLRHQRRLQALTLAGLFAFCFVAFWDNWTFDPYRFEAGRRIDGRACVKAYYEGTGDGRCPTIYTDDTVHIPLSTWLDGAKAVNASFYRNIREEIDRENQAQPGSR
jgi:hypothetical protein